jgi:hypothetical protein
MESFLDALSELIASTDDLCGAELIGALELVKQQLIFDLLTTDDDTDDEVAE